MIISTFGDCIIQMASSSFPSHRPGGCALILPKITLTKKRYLPNKEGGLPSFPRGSGPLEARHPGVSGPLPPSWGSESSIRETTTGAWIPAFAGMTTETSEPLSFPRRRESSSYYSQSAKLIRCVEFAQRSFPAATRCFHRSTRWIGEFPWFCNAGVFPGQRWSEPGKSSSNQLSGQECPR